MIRKPTYFQKKYILQEGEQVKDKKKQQKKSSNKASQALLR